VALEPPSSAPPFSKTICPKAESAWAIKLDRSLSSEQDQVGEALGHQGRHLDEVGIAALKALLNELIDVTVQTVGHLVPLSGSGSDTASAGCPFSKALESCLTRTRGANERP
jgi:hypothetical protein